MTLGKITSTETSRIVSLSPSNNKKRADASAVDIDFVQGAHRQISRNQPSTSSVQVPITYHIIGLLLNIWLMQSSSGGR